MRLGEPGKKTQRCRRVCVNSTPQMSEFAFFSGNSLPANVRGGRSRFDRSHLGGNSGTESFRVRVGIGLASVAFDYLLNEYIPFKRTKWWDNLCRAIRSEMPPARKLCHTPSDRREGPCRRSNTTLLLGL